MTSKRILFAGTPDFAVPCLQALLESSHSVIAVYTQPDRPAGRGRKLTASPVKHLALTHSLPVYQPISLKPVETQIELANLQADIMVVVAYGLILPKAVLTSPKYGCINVHASLLPRWRGAAPIQRALLAGDTQTGITLMQMDEGLDTGATLLQQSIPILPTDTSEQLHDRLAISGPPLLLHTLDNLERLTPIPQDHAQATYAHKLNKAEAQLNWQEAAVTLARKIRAFNPFPVAQATVGNHLLRLWLARALPDTITDKPVGTILQADRHGIDIVTGEGILRLLTVQRAGGKPVAVGDFLNAYPLY
jgi:methionyl-tRNA formyltransferase